MIKKIVLLVLSLILSVTILEFGIRKAFPFYHPGRQIVFKQNPDYNNAAFGPANETIRQRTPKGDYDLSVTFNRHGFRDDKDLSASNANDLFALGDSFAMGWGVETNERFSDVLSAALDRRVFNIAIPGDLKTHQGLLEYSRQNGARINFLIVGVCMNNDLKNYSREDKFQPAIYGDRQPWKARLRSKLQSKSALYLFLSYELQRNRYIRKLFERAGISRDINELTLQNIYDEDVINSSVDELMHIIDPYSNDRHIVLIIPSMAIWLGDNREQELNIHRTFISRIEEKGIRVLDMLPALEATGNPLSHYFTTDPHWNVKGHALAGEALATMYRQLKENE